MTNQLNQNTLFGGNPDWWGFLGVHPSLREVLEQLDWSGDVWLTEVGWRTNDLSEQQVANYKFDFLARLRTTIRKQELSRDIFPELYEE